MLKDIISESAEMPEMLQDLEAAWERTAEEVGFAPGIRGLDVIRRGKKYRRAAEAQRGRKRTRPGWTMLETANHRGGREELPWS